MIMLRSAFIGAVTSLVCRTSAVHSCVRASASGCQFTRRMTTSNDLIGVDQVQAALMAEQCILIDEDDKGIGSASKKVCHAMENINKGMLHRAFSVFLFNPEGKLLLQQRSDAKITYPAHWTNTCCSHPLHTQLELDENDDIGVRRAAQRKLNQELGIRSSQISVDDFTYLTRIHYQSENVPFDGKWGEHEIDYILFAQKNVDVIPNENEVKAHRYVSPQELQQLLDEADSTETLITPWFKLIADRFLFTWWNHLDDLSSQKDVTTIHRMS